MNVRRLIFSLLCASLLWLGFVPVLSADDFGDGLTRFYAGDYAEALRLLRPEAEKGSGISQFYVGKIYAIGGKGVPQDRKVAVGWFLKAAEQGAPAAEFMLGLSYENGWGVTQDYKAASNWYRKAAEQGDDHGQYFLGLMYLDGRGVTQDYKVAVGWFLKAAEQGNSEAQGNLGTMYAKGQGVPQDYVQGHTWLNLGASSAAYAKTRDLFTKNRNILAAKMTPAQIAEAQALARDWKPK